MQLLLTACQLPAGQLALRRSVLRTQTCWLRGDICKQRSRKRGSGSNVDTQPPP
eukprot:COSAG01_NODE_49821_length_368_cov_11.408922_1_plen_53_part_10